MRDACRAVTRCKKANRELAKAKAQGERLGEPYAEVGFRSRKHPKQGCYIPRRAVTNTAPIAPSWETSAWPSSCPTGTKTAG